MKYTNLKAFEKHLESTPLDHLPPVYLILAEDEGFLFWGEKTVLNYFNQKAPFSTERWDGLTVKRMKERFSSRSFFQKTTLFITPLEETDEEIATFFENGLKGHHLLIKGSKLLPQSKLYKAIEKEGVIFQIGNIKPYEKEKILIDWLLETRRVTSDVATYIVQRVDGDFSLLLGEWEKLLVYVGDQKIITKSDVDQIVIREAKKEAFSLIEAIARRDGKKVLNKLSDLIDVESSPIALLRLISGGFQNLFHLHSLISQGIPPEAIQKDLPYIQGRILQEMVTTIKQTSMEDIRDRLILLESLETEYKSGSRSDPLFLDYMVSKLLQAPRRN